MSDPHGERMTVGDFIKDIPNNGIKYLASE